MKAPLRLIARLDVRNGNHIKTIMCEGVRIINTVESSISKFIGIDNQADEIFIIDTVASLYGKDNWLLRHNDYLYSSIPLSISGGISSLQHVERTLALGADKISVNTSAIESPHLLSKISDSIGRQSLVLQVDAKIIDDKYMCMTRGGREVSGFEVKDWISCSASHGVGEIFLTCVDTEGTTKGFPFQLADIAFDSTVLPITLSGGIRTSDQIESIYKTYMPSAIALSSAVNILGHSFNDLRESLSDLGIPVRK